MAIDVSTYQHGRVPRDVRRAQLLEIAADAFAARGYDGLTMADVAQAAGVTKPVVYEIFGSKDGLYRALIERSADALAERTAAAVASESDAMAQLRAGGIAFFRFAADDREAFRMLYAGDAAGRFADEVTAIRVRQARLVADLLAAQARALGAQPDPEQVDGAAHALNGAYEALAAWATGHPDFSPEALSDWIVALVGPGLMNLATTQKETTE